MMVGENAKGNVLISVVADGGIITLQLINSIPGDVEA